MADNIPISNPDDSIPLPQPNDSIPIDNSYVPNPNAPAPAPASGWNAPWTFDNWNRDFLRTPQSGSDPFTQDQVSVGLQQGNTYSDFTGAAISADHDTPPPRPDLGSLYSDVPPDQSTFQQPSWTDLLGSEFKRQEAVGTTPRGMEVTPDQAGSIMPGGMIEGAGIDIAGTIAAKVARLSRLANENTVGGAMESGNFSRNVLSRMQDNGQIGAGVRGLVTTSTAEGRVPFLTNSDWATIGRVVGSRTVRYPLGAIVGSAALQPDKSGF